MVLQLNRSSSTPAKRFHCALRSKRQFLKNILNKDKYDNDTIAGNEMDLAFERLEKWREDNKEFFEPDFDWKKEVKEAINEKYGL